MIHPTNENVIQSILATNQTASAILSIKGFYLLEILFNDSPYYIKKTKNSFEKSSTSKNSILGHLFKINGQTFCTGDNGIYRIENLNLFTIDSLSFPIEEDVILTYHASFKQTNLQSAGEDILLPKPYNFTTKKNVSQIWRRMSAGDTVPIDNKYLQIEADAGSYFKIDEKDFYIGETEFLNYLERASSLTFVKGKDTSIDVNIICYDKE